MAAKFTAIGRELYRHRGQKPTPTRTTREQRMERPGYNGKVSPFTTAVKIHVTSNITQTSVLRINKGIRMQQKQGNAVLIYRQKLLKKHNSPKRRK